MKIYSRIVIDIASMKTLREESIEYSGPISQCKPGGGGGGAVTAYPVYLQTEHQRWISGDIGQNNSFPFQGKSVTQLITEAQLSTNPYAGYVPVDVSGVFMGIGKSIADYTSPYERINAFSAYDIDTKYTEYTSITDPLIADAISQHSTILDDEYNSKILPAFEQGMADINAVMSSAFVIGRGILLDTKQKQISKFTKDLQLQAFDWASKRVSLNMEMHRLLVASSTEISRMYTAAVMERDKEQLDFNEKDELWDLSLFQYGTQVMAAISGTATQDQKIPSQSKIAGALSGAMTGASAGGAVGGPYGAAAGAGIGGLLGVFG